ncbi:hypothetical protein DFH11DRAFT_420772 [Phellopilus nigrolimitatus]|nr:hypothetical protein DFH11DRAFT_420772 [Phellopilus nigrolimitatus]
MGLLHIMRELIGALISNMKLLAFEINEHDGHGYFPRIRIPEFRGNEPCLSIVDERRAVRCDLWRRAIVIIGAPCKDCAVICGSLPQCRLGQYRMLAGPSLLISFVMHLIFACFMLASMDTLLTPTSLKGQTPISFDNSVINCLWRGFGFWVNFPRHLRSRVSPEKPEVSDELF